MTRTTAAAHPETPNLCPPPNPADVVRISAPEWRAFVALVAIGVAAACVVAWNVWRIAAAAEPQGTIRVNMEDR